VRRILALLVVGMAVLIAITRAQVRAQSASTDAFAVASIKPNVSGKDGGSMGFQPGGRFRALNIPAQSLIAIAFGAPGRSLLPVQIVGGPSWLATDRFDIEARVDSTLPSDVQSLSTHRSAMLRTLLEDRFKLKTHLETRQEQIYALVKARTDGRLGPGLRPSTVDCLALLQAGRDNPSTAPSLPSACTNGVEFGFGILSGSSVQISNLAPTLSGAVERLVVDRTDLTGNFDMDLHWTPGVLADATSDAVSIFTAVQEQLGLKLESTTGPVDVLVIDHVEHPTED
jgi:uncharacterized protein (TIGR03435 family)